MSAPLTGQALVASPSNPQAVSTEGFDPSREECAKCGRPQVRIVVEGQPLCDIHRKEWISAEVRMASEERVCRVMRVLDKIADEPINDNWDAHLRRMAEAAVDAADGRDESL